MKMDKKLKREVKFIKPL